MRLSGVHICSIHFSQHDNRNPGLVKGGITSRDDWCSPAAARAAKTGNAAKAGAKAVKTAKPAA